MYECNPDIQTRIATEIKNGSVATPPIWYCYRAGSSPEVDEAIQLHEPLEAFLRQAKDESASLPEGYAGLAQILGRLETER